MEMTKEEIEKFWADKVEADKKIRERNKRHKEIQELFNSSKLTALNPLWHTDLNDIDLSKQRENLRDDLLEDGFTILQNIDIELLFDKMPSGNPELFREKNLYNDDLNDWKISDVIDNWLNNIKLIPPTILVIDKIIDSFIEDTCQIFPTDGKHRINVAYYYGATTIPIFVVNKQLEKIKTILYLK
jgi:hypothetical protein